VDLFGMYGSRSDDEPDEDTTERSEHAAPPEVRPSEDEHHEAADITQPIPAAAIEQPDSILDRPLAPETAESVAAYIAEIGTVVDESMLLRPYVRTGGRTKADVELAIEALVIGVPTIRDPSEIAPEHRQVHALCAEPRSVAEIAAYTRVPIGSARVIIADMLGLGMLVQCSPEPPAEAPSMDLMARVRDGLRNL
jgi:hypothetical protein